MRLGRWSAPAKSAASAAGAAPPSAGCRRPNRTWGELMPSSCKSCSVRDGGAGGGQGRPGPPPSGSAMRAGGGGGGGWGPWPQTVVCRTRKVLVCKGAEDRWRRISPPRRPGPVRRARRVERTGDGAAAGRRALRGQVCRARSAGDPTPSVRPVSLGRRWRWASLAVRVRARHALFGRVPFRSYPPLARARPTHDASAAHAAPARAAATRRHPVPVPPPPPSFSAGCLSLNHARSLRRRGRRPLWRQQSDGVEAISSAAARALLSGCCTPAAGHPPVCCWRCGRRRRRSGDGAVGAPYRHEATGCVAHCGRD